MNLNEILITDQATMKELKKLRSDEVRIQEYKELFLGLCTMDFEEGKQALERLYEYKQNEPIRYYESLFFKDGSVMSVQASMAHNCEPSITLMDAEKYSSFEVQTNFKVKEWSDERRDGKIYSYVERNKLKDLIKKKMDEIGLVR